MADADRLSALATHLYVRLKRESGRAIDVIWAARNADYAREVLRLARIIPDAEMTRLADAFEMEWFGVVTRAQAGTPAAAPAPDSSRDAEAPIAPQVANRYRGTLR